MKIFLCVALSCVLLHLVKADDPKTIMRVAVVEGNPTATKDKDKTLIRTNADKYLSDVRTLISKNNPQEFDIIVFPEYGLTRRTDDKANAIEINMNISSSDNDLQYLNEQANKSTIIVANLLEKDDDDLYSTTVVLDGTDKLLAKYRKINVNDTEKNLKSADEVITFIHPTLGNTIGLISGDDILYENPIRKLVENNATTIIFTTSMKSIAPFSVSLALQAGFAKAEGVNLLVASLSEPDNGASGSGVHTPCNTATQFISADKVSKVSSAQISVNPTKDCGTSSLKHGFRTTLLGTTTPLSKLLTYDFIGLKTMIVNETIQYQELCDGSFCCKFNITTKKIVSGETYRLAVGGEDQKICALMFCKDNSDDLKNCGNIDGQATTTFDEISIETSEDDDLFRPYILHSDLLSDSNIGKVNFVENSDEGTTFISTSLKNAIAVGIVSAKSGANTLQILTTNVIILSVLLKYLF